MRIKYKILWIDDSPEWVESILDEIKEYLLGFGFVLEYDIKSSYKGIDFSQYDILAVDCNLINEEKGIDALDLIRHEEVYTEILFYSQNGEAVLREEMKNNRVDGVYCASREDSVDKLKKLILTTIQKTQEINNLRGLVMAETSELDNLMKLILLQKEWGEEHFLNRHTELDKYYDEKKDKLQKCLPFAADKLIPLVYGHFSSMFSLWSLEKFLSKEDWVNIKEYKEIMNKRNVLAHGVELSSSANEITIEKTKPDGSKEMITFTPDDFIELRKKIKDFRGKFEKILRGE
jgi:hypothetical protein